MYVYVIYIYSIGQKFRNLFILLRKCESLLYYNVMPYIKLSRPRERPKINKIKHIFGR